MPRYHTCRAVYRRYDESLLAKPGVPCWLARAVEVKQPHGGHWFDGYRWSEDAAQHRRLRWHDGFWRRRVDGSWPAVVVIHIPSN